MSDDNQWRPNAALSDVAALWMHGRMLSFTINGHYSQMAIEESQIIKIRLCDGMLHVEIGFPTNGTPNSAGAGV